MLTRERLLDKAYLLSYYGTKMTATEARLRHEEFADKYGAELADLKLASFTSAEEAKRIQQVAAKLEAERLAAVEARLKHEKFVEQVAPYFDAEGVLKIEAPCLTAIEVNLRYKEGLVAAAKQVPMFDNLIAQFIEKAKRELERIRGIEYVAEGLTVKAMTQKQAASQFYGEQFPPSPGIQRSDVSGIATLAMLEGRTVKVPPTKPTTSAKPPLPGFDITASGDHRLGRFK